MSRRYPIDGLWLTESELTRYFLGQLEIESHMRVRQVDLPDMPPAYVAEEKPPKPKRAPREVQRVVEDQGLPL